MRQLMLCTLLFAWACGGSPKADPAPEAPALTLDGDYTLQPGQENYLCYTMNLPSDDIVLTKIVPTYGIGTHHILLAQTIAPEPKGKSECKVLFKTTWVPLYAGGKDSGQLALPSDSGFKPVVKGQQILLQLHLQNTTSAPITARTSMHIEYAPAATVTKRAGIWGMDDRAIALAPHSASTKMSMSCMADKEMSVFGVLGHMHKFGKRLTLSRGKTLGAEVLYDEPWQFDLQPIVPKVFTVAKGDQMFLECEHANNGDKTIGYGESSDNEMCSAVLYYTPYDSLDGCIKM